MNAVELVAEGMEPPAWAPGAEAFALSVLERLGVDFWEVSILVAGDEALKRLNAEFRSIDEPTDVLSFASGETVPDPEGGHERYLAGDIAISLDALARNAAEFSVGEDEELRRLILHGILHLSGMDHATNDSTEPMLQFQENMLKSIPEAKILT
jgi:probable rRNA maturation factor